MHIEISEYDSFFLWGFKFQSKYNEVAIFKDIWVAI